MTKRTVWICRDRQGEKVFLEKPTYHNGHDILLGKQASFSRVVSKRKLYRVVTKFVVKVEGPFQGPISYNYAHSRANGTSL